MAYCFKLIGLLFLAHCLANQSNARSPSEKMSYGFPAIVKMERKVIYARDTADIYISLTAIIPVSELKVTLKSSHSGLQLQSQGKEIPETSYSLLLEPGTPYKLRHRIHKSSSFTLASISLSLEYDFDPKDLKHWVLQRSKLRYKNPLARKKLLEELKAIHLPYEQVTGVFLYGSRFLQF